MSGLWDVRPSFTVLDRHYGASPKSIFCGDNVMLPRVISDTSYLLWSHFGAIAWGIDSALTRAVRHIVGLRAKKQVLWVHASRIVATVENIEPCWDWTASECPRHAVREHIGPWSRTILRFIREAAVSLIVQLSFPEPTRVGFSYLRPKSLFKREVRSPASPYLL